METFNIQDFILNLLIDGAPAMVLSGWLSTKMTHLSGTAMLIQTWVLAIALTFFYALVGIIPVSVTELWTLITSGFANGLIANLIYKSGILDSLMLKIGAKQPETLTS